MIAAVFDCMVFLQAVTNDRGPAFACLALVEAKTIRLYISDAILTEVRDVLTRPRIRAKFPHLTPERVELFLGKVATISVVVSEVSDAGFVLRDADDLPYLNLAVAADVGYLVSRDNDLLDLMSDSAFVVKYPRLRIVDPVAFLAVVRAQPAA